MVVRQAVRVGFTGTRQGMTKFQRQVLLNRLQELRATHLHHGDCVGADEDADGVARMLGLARCIHPPTEERMRAHCEKHDGKNVLLSLPFPYLTRNRHIVDHSHLLIACPKELDEPSGGERAGGTWYTVRYARTVDKRVEIIYP